MVSEIFLTLFDNSIQYVCGFFFMKMKSRDITDDSFPLM